MFLDYQDCHEHNILPLASRRTVVKDGGKANLGENIVNKIKIQTNNDRFGLYFKYQDCHEHNLLLSTSGRTVVSSLVVCEANFVKKN